MFSYPPLYLKLMVQGSTPQINNKQNALAMKAANDVGPRTYILKNSTNDQNHTPRFYTFGCQGGAAAQKEVAELIKKIQNDPTHKPDFILILGDNFYDYGVDSADSPDFISKFDEIYKKLGIPCFVILGNHDENLHKLGMMVTEKGLTRGMHQVAHSYLPEGNYVSIKSKQDLYSQSELELSKLPTWNMPSRFYSIIDGNTQIFCLDSNTYVHDYLESHFNNDPNNQANWLAVEMLKAKQAGRRVQVAMHHPPFTPGYRAYDCDVDIYLTKSDIVLAQNQLKLEGKIPYNYYLKAAFDKQELQFDTIFTAHDHAMYYYNDGHYCQLTSGGGGGKTQSRQYFAEQDNMGCYLKNHGVTEVVCPDDVKKPAELTLYTTKNKILKFNTQSNKPLQSFNNEWSLQEKNEVLDLIAIIEKSIKKYLSFLDQRQSDKSGFFFKTNLSHGGDGVNRAHDLWAYISKPEVDDLKTMMEKVDDIMEWKRNWTNPTEHSLITILSKEIYQFYKKPFDQLYQEVCKRQPNKAINHANKF